MTNATTRIVTATSKNIYVNFEFRSGIHKDAKKGNFT